MFVEYFNLLVLGGQAPLCGFSVKLLECRQYRSAKSGDFGLEGRTLSMQ